LLVFAFAGCAKETVPIESSAPPSAAPPVVAAPPERPTPPPPPPGPAVIAPAPPPPAAAARPSSQPPRPASQEFVEEPALKDVLFDPGHTEIGRQGLVIMKANAVWLTGHADRLVLIEGHSDYLGTPEANKIAGEKRATAAKDYLVKAGITQTRIQIVSYGSDRPVCPQKTAACAARNRRVHFLVKPQ
jgi:outer membrane protein OmpA-like peptidoglycan-associated protein